MTKKRKLLIIWLVGFMSGFTIMISGNTLNFWLAKEQVDIKTIGIFALISLPYAINFIWAPIFDVKNIPILGSIFGRRISWIVIIQLFLCSFVYLIGELNPANNLLLFGVVALLISFLASAQDTVLGAFRTEIIDPAEQGSVSGIYIFGYRIGMLLSSSLAIYISAYIAWNIIYKLFSLVILCFPLLLLLTKNWGLNNNNNISLGSDKPQSHFNFFIAQILKPIGSIKYIIFVLIFLILYRLPDNFIGMMINLFFIHIGYNEFEISTVGKFFGIITAIIGGLLAGIVMKRVSIFRSLLLFGALHGVAHLLFIVQEIYGKNIELFLLVTGFESITGGMSMAAYIGFIASLCKGRFKATQYSFFTSMMGLSRSILPAFSGYVVANVGWKIFYLSASVATIPALITILYLEKIRNN